MSAIQPRLPSVMPDWALRSNLPPETAGNHFETSDVKLLQIVLTGQEELSDKIKRYKELKSHMIPIAINSMSPMDLQDMLRFRWSVASASSSEVPFMEEAYQEI